MNTSFDRRTFLQAMGLAAGAAAFPGVARAASEAKRPPNIIVLFADDMGYGDLGCYGHPTIRTPHLDQMARDGVRMTSFYVAAPVCSPSRAALLTGRYPVRCGMPGNTGPGRDTHLPRSEVTMADMLKGAGYRTMCVGKWHLGHQNPDVFPMGRGFDQWYGLPYSNDMRKPWVQTDIPLKLYRNNEAIEHPVDQNTLTERYTNEAVKFIQDSGDDPFFLYLAYSMPHLPVRTAERFRGESEAGLYGDVIETIDWSAGRIREVLEEQGLAEDTLLVFTSDNGPWLDLPDRMLQEGNERWHGGSPGPLRGAKGTTYEGGMRVPMMAVWPGHIPAGTRNAEVASTMDLLPTFAKVTGAALPDDRTLDGDNILPVMQGEAESPHEYFYYFRGARLQGVRQDVWKLRKEDASAETQLFHLGRDPRELYNVAEDHPDIVEHLLQRMNAFRREVQEQ
ncbi:MAG: sulfatase [Candidatus Hydrogenedentota bacterium]